MLHIVRYIQYILVLVRLIIHSCMMYVCSGQISGYFRWVSEPVEKSTLVSLHLPVWKQQVLMRVSNNVIFLFFRKKLIKPGLSLETSLECHQNVPKFFCFFKCCAFHLPRLKKRKKCLKIIWTIGYREISAKKINREIYTCVSILLFAGSPNHAA